MKNNKWQRFDLNNISTDNFVMTPLELKDYIDFEVKRVYFISEPKGEMEAGSHCHTDEEDELFIMISGSCVAELDDGESGLQKVELKGPNHALYVPRMVWHYFEDFSDDAVLLALSSTNYDPERKGYCEDYEEFKKIVREQDES